MVYSNPFELNPSLLLPRHKRRPGRKSLNPVPRREKDRRHLRELKAEHDLGFVPSKPPGTVQAAAPLPKVPLVIQTRPTPAVGREMLYELIQLFGTFEAARMLGIELQPDTSKILGNDAYFDALISKTNLRSIWFMWSIAFCPSNFRDAFHIQTWGIYNEAYVGKPADAHRAVFYKRLRQPNTRQRKTKLDKKREARQKRIEKLPVELRYVYSRDPEKLALRKKLMAKIIADEKREAAENKRKNGKNRGAAQKVLHNISRRTAAQGSVNRNPMPGAPGPKPPKTA